MLKKLRGRDDGAAVHAAVFGKHPGWEDHIPDLGLTTERLAHLKRELYLDGVGRNIDTGSWDNLDADRRLEAFGHLFAWFKGDEWIMGRMWSSVDGKGRSKYPMITCVHVSRLRFEDFAPTVYREVCSIESASRAASTAEAVDQALRDSVGRLKSRVTRLEPGLDTEIKRCDALAELARHPDMGEEAIGMYRLMYEIDREMDQYRSSGDLGTLCRGVAPLTETGSRYTARGQDLRVPRCGADDLDSLGVWRRFLEDRLSPVVPRWILIPSGQSWVDLLIGPTNSALFTCLRVLPTEMPLTTDVPYQLGNEFVEKLRSYVANLSSTPAGT